MKDIGLKELGQYTCKRFEMQDKRRTQNMNRKASPKFKARGRQLQLLKKTKNAKKCHQSYISGDFGLEAIPESRKEKEA